MRGFPTGSAVRHLGSFREPPPEGELPELAVAGRSNVGKSSLINALLDRKRLAPVGRTPGRTRAIELYAVGERFVLVDLPGYGYARVPASQRRRWKELVEGYLAGRRQLRGVLVLLDPRREPGGDDAVLVEGLRSAGIPLLAVATRIDRLGRRERRPALERLRSAYDLPPGQPLAFSARTREGLEELRRAVLELVGGG